MEFGAFVDLRRSRRVCRTNPIRLALASEDYRVKHDALTMDESSCGVAIMTVTPLFPGETIMVFPQEGARYSIPARVVWVRQAEVSLISAAGLEFLVPLAS
jgi:hypothetical protein